MKKTTLFSLTTLSFLLVVALTTLPNQSMAASAADIDSQARLALEGLYKINPTAKQLSERAKGILVFPKVVKAGLLVGGQYGEGALFREGKTIGYYNTVAASFGLQAGAQSFGYAMFFMSDSDLGYLFDSDGWEVGVGPSVVIVNEGIAKSLTTTTTRGGVYAFFFSHQGLMAGLGLQGTKITKITPGK